MINVTTVQKILKVDPSMGVDKFLKKIIKDDARKLLGALPRESIDLTITSPPYDDLRDYAKK